MKLTKSKLKQLIKEELSSLKEIAIDEFYLQSPGGGKYRTTRLYPKPFANIRDAQEFARVDGLLQQYGNVEVADDRGDIYSTYDPFTGRWMDKHSFG